jgi:ribosomal protein S6
MPEMDDPSISSSNSKNVVEDLYVNMYDQTFSKSPYVADSYKMPYNPDDLYQKNFDYSIYENMAQDDQVNVCLRLKKDLILGDGMNIAPGDSNQEEIVEFIEDALLKQYEGDFVDDLEEILTAYEFGFSLSEKVFKMGAENQLVLKYLRTRHPNSWLIFQDDRGSITKYQQKAVEGDIEVNPKALIHYINDKRFQNPYGTSDLRAAYNAWVAKTHVIRYFSIYLEKAASPIPYARYDKNAPVGFSDSLLNVLKRFQTKTAIAVSKDVEISFLEAKTQGEAYHKAIHLFNMIIGRSLFVPDLVGFTGGETGGGSLALGKEQMNLFFKHINRRRSAIESLVNKEIIKPMIEFNFGFIEKPPEFKFKPIDELQSVEFAKIWLDAVKGNAYQANEEEINHFRKLVKFPEGNVVFKQPIALGGGDPNAAKPGQEESEDLLLRDRAWRVQSRCRRSAHARQLAYPINKIHKAHYILMNIECDQKTLDELEELFRYNDAIIRSLIIRRNAAITEESLLAKSAEEKRARKALRSNDDRDDRSDTAEIPAFEE